MRVPLALSRAAFTAGFVAHKFSRRIREDPYRWLRLAQRVDPVHHSSLGLWLVMSHSAVTAALRNPAIDRLEVPERVVMRSRVLRRIFNQTTPDVKEASPAYNLWSDAAIFTDPALQPLKAFVTRTFTPRRLAELRPAIEGFVEPVLNEAAERGRTEIIGEVAQRLPVRLICLLLGVPPSEELLFDNALDVIGGIEPSPLRSPGGLERADRAAVVLHEYISALVAERRRSPRDDLVSALIGLNDAEGTPGNDALVVATVLILWFAGQATTAMLIGNGVLALLQHPQELARWHDDPSIEATAIEELLRYDTPVMFTARDAVDDTELDGRRLRRGSLVVIMYGAANHDPRVFEDPWKLDLDRSPNPHVSFGGGEHYCTGAALARLEAGVFFTSFARRFPDARIAPGGVVRRNGLILRGLRKLEILTR